MEPNDVNAREKWLFDTFLERFPTAELPAPSGSYLVDLDGSVYRERQGSQEWYFTGKFMPEAATKLRGIPDALPIKIGANGRYLYDDPRLAPPLVMPRPHPELHASRNSGAAALLGAVVLLAAIGTVIGLVVAHHLDAGRKPSRVLADSADADGQRAVSALAFSPDGRKLVAADSYSGADLWDLGTFHLIGVLAPSNLDDLFTPTAAAFSSNGRLFAVGDAQGSTVLWRARKIRRLHVLTDAINNDNGVGGVFGVAFSPDTRILAAGDFNGHAYLWNTTTGHRIARLTVSTNGNLVGAVAFSPQGKILAIGDDEGTVSLWNADDQTRTAVLDYAHSPGGAIGGIAFSPDGRHLAALYTDGNTVIWNLASRTAITVLKTGDPEDGRCSIAFSPDGRELIAGCDGPSTYLWNVRDGKQVAKLTAPSATGAIDATAFSPNGRTVAAGSDAGYIYLWNLPKADR